MEVVKKSIHASSISWKELNSRHCAFKVEVSPCDVRIRMFASFLLQCFDSEGASTAESILSTTTIIPS